MHLQIEDYASRFRNTDVERSLASELRKLPEEDRLHFIKKLLTDPHRHSFAVALWLVRTCLHDRQSFLTILNQGLDEANASSIKYWLEAVVDGLGFRRIVSILSKRLSENPRSVIQARYWLPKWLPRDNKASRDAFARLNQEIEAVIQKNPNLEALVKPIRHAD